MKKSLSTILALAMTFSAFSSVALGADAAKTSADFSDLKDLDAATKAKFDALISAGIFDGVADGKFGLKDEMNRAQFAKVAALIFGLKVDSSLKTSSFADVKADDPANGYALPYIEAVKAAGITDGYGPNEFNPAGKVTKEQLAAFLIRGLGKDKDAKATPGVNDATVSDWAKGYVALALQLKVLNNGADGKFGGQSNATRDLLVLGSYEAKQQYVPNFNGKYAIGSLKATDANVLTLQLNGALTEEAAKNFKIEVKRDGGVVTNYTTKWDDKKTVATLTFDAKFQDSKYEVTISGVSNIDEANKTASVTTSVEKITKIDFLTASETIPLVWNSKTGTSKKVRVDFKATNQYGAQAKLSAASFDIRTSSNATATAIGGEQAFNLTQESDTRINDRISVTITHTDSGVQVNKVFTVGMEQMVSKIELGDFVNGAGTKVDTIDAEGGYAYLQYKAYDQYGFKVEDKDVLNDYVNVVTTDNDLETGEVGNDDPFVASVIGDDAAEMRFYTTGDEDKDVTVTVFATGSGQSVTKNVKIIAAKKPASIEFGSYNYTLAEGDKITGEDEFDKKFYIPLVAKDANGNTLDADDMVDAANKFRIDFGSGLKEVLDGNNRVYIQKTGPYKGYIVIGEAARKGSTYVRVSLEDKPLVSKTLNLNVGEARKMESLKFSAAPKKYIVPGIGAGNKSDTELKIKAYDQYGDAIKTDNNNDFDYKVALKFSLTGAPSGADPLALKKTYLESKTDVAGLGSLPTPYKFEAVTGAVYQTATVNSVADIYDQSFKFFSENGAQTDATYAFEAKLIKIDLKDGNKESVASTLTTTLDVLKTNDTGLSYEVYLDKGVNNTLLAVKDYNLSTVAGATYDYPKVLHEVKARAKKGGQDVAMNSVVTSLTSSNKLAVDAGTVNKLVGVEAGTAKISVIYQDAEGKQRNGSLDVTSKNEAPSVTSMVFTKTTGSVTGSALAAGMYVWDELLGKKLVVKDQFGDEFVSEGTPGPNYNDFGKHGATKVTRDQFVADASAAGGAYNKHKDLLNLSYYITDAKFANANTSVAVSEGKITRTGTLKAGDTFTVNIMAPSGVSAAVTVTVSADE